MQWGLNMENNYFSETKAYYINSPKVEQIKGGGCVILEEMLGDDLTPARVARISRLSEGPETDDERLIKNLLEWGHETPFEHQVFRFKIEDIPIYIAEQVLRHRMASPLKRSFRFTGPNSNLLSETTADSLNKIVHIPPEFLGLKESELSQDKEVLLNEILVHIKKSFELYENLISAGLRKEAARTILPFGLRTSFYWTINMRSLMNFLRQRLDSHAQWEMRELAKAIVRLLKQVVPVTIESFLERFNLTDKLD